MGATPNEPSEAGAHMGHLGLQEGALGALFVTLQALVGLGEVQYTWHLCWNGPFWPCMTLALFNGRDKVLVKKQLIGVS